MTDAADSTSTFDMTFEASIIFLARRKGWQVPTTPLILTVSNISALATIILTVCIMHRVSRHTIVYLRAKTVRGKFDSKDILLDYGRSPNNGPTSRWRMNIEPRSKTCSMHERRKEMVYSAERACPIRCILLFMRLIIISFVKFRWDGYFATTNLQNTQNHHSSMYVENEAPLNVLLYFYCLVYFYKFGREHNFMILCTFTLSLTHLSVHTEEHTLPQVR